MKSKRFVIRNQSIKENALWAIRNLPSDKPWEVTIKRYVKPRSNNQHGYYRVLVDLLSEHSGFEKDEIHDMMRTKAGLWKTISGVEILKSSKEISVVEMSELIETTLRSGAQDFEMSLPQPTQVFVE